MSATIDPKSLKAFYEPQGTLRLTVGEDRSYLTVKVCQAWPLSEPGRFLSFLDGKGEEILTVERAAELLPESRAAVEEELRRRYLTARVEAILEVRMEFGATYWHVRTDRGERDFVVQSLTESCARLSDDHLLIIDVDGTRFEIPSIAALDEESRNRLDSVL